MLSFEIAYLHTYRAAESFVLIILLFHPAAAVQTSHIPTSGSRIDAHGHLSYNADKINDYRYQKKQWLTEIKEIEAETTGYWLRCHRSCTVAVNRPVTADFPLLAGWAQERNEI